MSFNMPTATSTEFWMTLAVPLHAKRYAWKPIAACEPLCQQSFWPGVAASGAWTAAP